MTAQHNAGTSAATMVIEPTGIEMSKTYDKHTQQRYAVQRVSTTEQRSASLDQTRSTGSNSKDRNETLPSPSISAVEQLECWNSPRINIYRVLATFWSLMVIGMNDGATGALIPYLESYYGLTYTIISILFLSPFVGYTIAAILNNSIHMRFGQRGVAYIGSVVKIVAYSVTIAHPPYPVLVLAFMTAGFANGIQDAGWNAWIGAMSNANELLGFLHGFYGLGATIAPLIATTMVTKAGLPWYAWYYVMVSHPKIARCTRSNMAKLGCSVIELATSGHAFWKATGEAFRQAHPRTSDASGSRFKEALVNKPAARVTWTCSAFLLGYVGTEVALGGWITTYMIRVRDGNPFASGMTATGFWLGITLGRLILGFVTPRLGEKLAISIYLPIAMAMELLFWLVPQFYVSAVAVALQGFFLGPLFPASVIAMTKILPKHLHVGAIGFAAAVGGSGGAIFPFAVGAIAQAKGVQVLQPIVLALLAVILMLWLSLPRIGRKTD